MTPNTFPSRKRALAVVASVSLAVAGLAVAPVAGAAVATTPTFALSQSSGPQLGGNSITLTAGSAVFNTTLAGGLYTSNTLQWQFASSATAKCGTHYTALAGTTATAGVLLQSTASKTKFNVLTTKKAVIQVPAPVGTGASSGSNTVTTYDGTGLVASGLTTTTVTSGGAFVSTTLPATSQLWLLCLYSSNDTTTSTLLASGGYTVAPAPTLSTVSPTGGPALGGGSVTVNGTNLTGATVKVGSLAISPVTVAVGGGSLTFTAPAMSAGAYDVSVTTTGGTKILAGAYTYSNGIVVSPATTPTLTPATDLDISGVGFSKLNFSTTTTGTTPDNGNAHVYVVSGGYDPTANSAAKTLGEVGECMNVLVISDSELICTVNTTHGYGGGNSDPALANGTYTITVVSNGGVDVQPSGSSADANYTQSIISSGATFTVANY